ncbi:MAG: hypothetical protein ABIH48_02415 [Candidatus Falkowbacteria bacterium]
MNSMWDFTFFEAFQETLKGMNDRGMLFLVAIVFLLAILTLYRNARRIRWRIVQNAIEHRFFRILPKKRIRH